MNMLCVARLSSSYVPCHVGRKRLYLRGTMSKELYIKSHIQHQYFISTASGCELWSNDRSMHIVISRIGVFNAAASNQQYAYSAISWLRYAHGWEKGNNAVSVSSIGDYMQRITHNPNFSSAIQGYRDTICK